MKKTTVQLKNTLQSLGEECELQNLGLDLKFSKSSRIFIPVKSFGLDCWREESAMNFGSYFRLYYHKFQRTGCSHLGINFFSLKSDSLSMTKGMSAWMDEQLLPTHPTSQLFSRGQIWPPWHGAACGLVEVLPNRHMPQVNAAKQRTAFSSLIFRK